jgi:hypothetical protein
MRARFAIAAVLAWTLAGAAAAQPARPQRFDIPGRGNLLLAVPPGWHVIDQARVSPPTLILRMRPASGDAFYVQITSVLVPPDKLASLGDEGIKSRVQESAQRMLPRALETEATLTELRGKGTAGYYFALTDRASPNSGDDYKYIVQGTMRSAALITVFTFLHRESASAEKELALRMLADASFLESVQRKEAP